MSKLDPAYNEKKLIKKYSLPKSATNHNQLLFVSAKSLLLFYSDDVHVSVFDGKKETFQKNAMMKADQSRRCLITTVAASPCGNFLLIADLLGDVQLWSFQNKTIESVHCSNLSTRSILCAEFIKNDYGNRLSHAVCYALDQQIYLVDFEQLSPGKYSLVLANKLVLSGSTDITLKEYKLLGIKPMLKASRTDKSFRIHALKVSRMSDGSLIPGTQTVEYKFKETLPVGSQVLFSKFSTNSLLEGYDPKTHTFTCKNAGEVYFATLQGLYVYLVPTGTTKQLIGFDTIFTKQDPTSRQDQSEDSKQEVFELNKITVTRLAEPSKNVIISAAVTLDKMSISASLVCVLVDTKTWRVKGEPLVLHKVVDFMLVPVTSSQSEEPLESAVSEGGVVSTQQTALKYELMVLEEFQRTLTVRMLELGSNPQKQQINLTKEPTRHVEFTETIQRLIISEEQPQIYRLYSKVRETIFAVSVDLLSETGSGDTETHSLSQKSLSEVKLNPAEIIHGHFFSRDFGDLPRSWVLGLLTNLRIILFSAADQIVAQYDLLASTLIGQNENMSLSAPGNPVGVSTSLCGTFEGHLILRVGDLIYSQLVAETDSCASVLDPELLIHIDSQNSLLVGILPDRLITCRTHLQEDEKVISVEMQQRQASSLGLLLENSLRKTTSTITSDVVESIVSVLWDSQFSESATKAVLLHSNDRVYLELACRFGGIEEILESDVGHILESDVSVKEYLLGCIKDFLRSRLIKDKDYPAAEIVRRYRAEFCADQAIEELLLKIGILLKLKILVSEDSEPKQDSGFEDPSRILPRLGDVLAQHELSAKNRRLKKRDVPFGQDVYRVLDQTSNQQFNLVNGKDVLGFMGFSKTRPPASNVIVGAGESNSAPAAPGISDANEDSDTEADGGFKQEDEECSGLLFLWRMDEDVCPQIKDTTERRINGVIKGSSYKWERFRGDCPLESEDKWGKVG